MAYFYLALNPIILNLPVFHLIPRKNKIVGTNRTPIACVLFTLPNIEISPIHIPIKAINIP